MDKVCRICLEKVSQYEEIGTKVKDLLETLMISLDMTLSQESIVCKKCVAHIYELSDFKTLCLHTENVLRPYIAREVVQLDLRSVYSEIKSRQFTESEEKTDICRLCLEIITQWVPLETAISQISIQNVFKSNLPEVSLQAIERPCICEDCLKMLNELSSMAFQCKNSANIVKVENLSAETSKDLTEAKDDDNIKIKVEIQSDNQIENQIQKLAVNEVKNEIENQFDECKIEMKENPMDHVEKDESVMCELRRKDELPFHWVDMSFEEFYDEMGHFDNIVEQIPSGSESEGDDSDSDELTDNVEVEVMDILISESEESEFDLPLSVVKKSIIYNANYTYNENSIQAYDPPKWSNASKPIAPRIFFHQSGVPAFIENMDEPTPYKILLELITEEFIFHLVLQTNLFAEQMKMSSGKNYISTSMKEMKTFLGINLLMGIKQSPSYKDYWSSAPELNDAFICGLMSLKRFSWLLSHLHVNDNSIMPGRSSPNFDKFFKIRPMIDILSTNFEKCLLPNQRIAAGESVMTFNGRNNLKKYMPKRPIKRGYKMWMLADKSGYCLKFDLYSGKTDAQEESLGFRIINHLTSHLRGKDHILYLDNFLNSVPLMEELKKHNIHAVGTVNIARRHLPTFKSDRTMKRGEYQWFTSNTGLAALKWKDTRILHIITNYHDPESVSGVKRKEKEGDITQVPCPDAVIDYNQNINYVDKFDQLLSSYKIDRRSRKWWHRIFFHLLDAAVVNAYCIYKILDLPKLSTKDFRRAVINGFLAEQLVHKKRQSTSMPMEFKEIKKSKPFTPLEIRLNSSTHQPERSSRRRCALCSTKAKQVRTDWICSVCKVPLCLTKNKSCFQRYHTT